MKKTLLSAVLLAICLLCHSQESICVMSYNIRYSNPKDGENAWDFRRDATVRMIRDAKPNVVGMQEVLAVQEEFMDSTLAEYGHIGVGREDGNRCGEMMLVLYDTATIELLEWGTFWLSDTPNIPGKGWDAAYIRTCTWAVMKDRRNGECFMMFNTHLDNMGKEARKMEIIQIADSIKTMSIRFGIDRAFLTGDLNTSATNEIFNPLKEVMSEARKESPVTDEGYTYNAFGKVDPTQKTHVLDENGNSDNAIAVDHIFYKGYTPREFRVLRGDYGVKFVSDHFPVVSEFTY